MDVAADAASDSGPADGDGAEDVVSPQLGPQRRPGIAARAAARHGAIAAPAEATAGHDAPVASEDTQAAAVGGEPQQQVALSLFARECGQAPMAGEKPEVGR